MIRKTTTYNQKSASMSTIPNWSSSTIIKSTTTVVLPNSTPTIQSTTIDNSLSSSTIMLSTSTIQSTTTDNSLSSSTIMLSTSTIQSTTTDFLQGSSSTINLSTSTLPHWSSSTIIISTTVGLPKSSSTIQISTYDSEQSSSTIILSTSMIPVTEYAIIISGGIKGSLFRSEGEDNLLGENGERHIELYLRSVEVIYSNGSFWCALPEMTENRYLHSQDGVTACGGVNKNDYSGSVSKTCVSLENQKWTEFSNLRRKRYGHSSLAAEGQIMLLGGMSSPDTSELVSRNNSIEGHNLQHQLW